MQSQVETLFVGQHLVIKDRIDSTNAFAQTLLSTSTLPKGAAIMAFEQTAGRGQRGATWESEYKKNLLVSFVFYPTFLHAKDFFHLNILFSLSLFDVTRDLHVINASIKWPNDIYIGDRKLAGMLIENSVRENTIAASVAGIGVNINQSKFNDYAVPPTSLKIAMKKNQDLMYVYKLLCGNIEARYLQLAAGRHATMKNEYISHLYRFDISSKFKTPSGIYAAKIVDVLNSGKIVLERSNGATKAYDFKEISFITE